MGRSASAARFDGRTMAKLLFRGRATLEEAVVAWKPLIDALHEYVYICQALFSTEPLPPMNQRSYIG
jgi:hypothetical protein